MSFADDGFVHHRGVFSADTVASLIAAIERTGTVDRPWLGPWIKHQFHQQHPVTLGISYSIHAQPEWQTAIASDSFQRALQSVKPGLACRSSMAIVKPAQTGQPFPWHQDAAYYGQGYAEAVLANVYLDDVTTENGSIEFIPGSHTKGFLPHSTLGKKHLESITGMKEPVCVPANAGDVVFFGIHVVHGSKPNLSEKPRRAVRLVFA